MGLKNIITSYYQITEVIKLVLSIRQYAEVKITGRPGNKPHRTNICLSNICETLPRDIPSIFGKKFPMKFRGIFQNNVPGILNTGIFPDCSMNILRMLHGFF